MDYGEVLIHLAISLKVQLTQVIKVQRLLGYISYPHRYAYVQ